MSGGLGIRGHVLEVAIYVVLDGINDSGVERARVSDEVVYTRVETFAINSLPERLDCCF